MLAGSFTRPMWVEQGDTVIADYGHNPDAMRALVDAVNAMPAKRRSVVISGAGDRRDEDIRELGYVAAKFFDVLVLREDDNLRRRPPGEAAAPAATAGGIEVVKMNPGA